MQRYDNTNWDCQRAQPAVATIGLNAQLINDGSGSSDPYKILLTGATGEENEFTITTTSSQAEVQNLSFGTAQSTGSFTVAGVSSLCQQVKLLL